MSKGKNKRRGDYALRMRFLKRTQRDRLVCDLVELADVIHLDHLRAIVGAARTLAHDPDATGCGFRLVKD